MKRIVLTGLALIMAAWIHAGAASVADRDIRKEYYLEQIGSTSLPGDEKLRYVDSLQPILGPRSLSFLQLKARVNEEAGRLEAASRAYAQVYECGDASLSQRMEALLSSIKIKDRIGDYHGAFDDIVALLSAEKPDSLDYYDIKAYFFIADIYGLLGDVTKCMQ